MNYKIKINDLKKNIMISILSLNSFDSLDKIYNSLGYKLLL